MRFFSRIYGKELRLEVWTKISLDVKLTTHEVFLHGLKVLMHYGIGPEGVIEDVLSSKYLDTLCVELFVLAEPVDLA